MSLKYILYLEKIDVWNTVVQKFEKKIFIVFFNLILLFLCPQILCFL